jgi:NarL family two-component system response regulator LiaR
VSSRQRQRRERDPRRADTSRTGIFTRLASGRSNQEIAAELSLSTNTVANHIASILAKLHLDNRIQAAVQAVRSGIS